DSLLFILQRMKLDWENRCICNNYAECYAHFFNFYRFNTALLLLNYSGNFDERRNYYNQISSLKNGVCDKGGVSLIFQLSFYFFYMLFNPLYFVYKRITCL
ncbi:glycosyltransferase family 2 protein, partial [Bacteroides thetaiotaomicron]|nr:glycosyltransferase family 2 protein [Bacteroides thetaiotaomicron]